MADWSALPDQDRKELLLLAAAESGRAPAILEKDAWVVWALGWIGRSPWASDLVFKGGTSLSKVHRAIERFSEDIDLTYDIRRLLPDLAGEQGDPLPASVSQAKKWSGIAREELVTWLTRDFVLALDAEATAIGVRIEQDGDSVYLHYPSAVGDAPDYLRTAVKLEFGGRATGEPAEWSAIQTDVAETLPEHAALMPQANVRTMATARTFWEKVTAMHVHCAQTRAPAERFARHWYDVASLHRAGLADAAIPDAALARKVVEYKQLFFVPTKSYGEVSYSDCVQGRLRVQPVDGQAALLREDYEAMLDAGYLWGWQPSWAEVMESIIDLQARINDAFAPEVAP